MIVQVTGTLIAKELDRIEILTDGGVAYELAVPLNAYEALPKTGERCAVHTYLVVNEFAPAEIKKAVVGTGGATKEQVQFMLTRLLRLKSVPTPSDAADGVAAALACLMGANLPRVGGSGRVREPSRPAASKLIVPPSITRRS